jgi:glycosyltransferase involved in cell wall biosynthesis
MSSETQVSIVMPVYNGEEFLKSAIESILNQTFIAFELIIINDGSTDESEAIMLSFSDKRILYINHVKNKGLVAALNTGISAASGKYIARMDQDDICLPNRIAAQYEFMEQHANVVLLGTQLQVVGEKNSSQMYSKSDELKTSLLIGTSFAHPTVMIRKSTIVQHNLKYDEAYLHAEDYGFWSQICQYGDIQNLNEVGIQYRKHPKQYTRVYSEQMRQTTRRIRKDYATHLGLTLNEFEFTLLNTISEKTYLQSECFDLKEAAEFLNLLVIHLSESGLEKSAVEKVIYSVWLNMCGSLQKAKKNSLYKEFRMFKKNPSIHDLKTHGWFLKHNLINLLN